MLFTLSIMLAIAKITLYYQYQDPYNEPTYIRNIMYVGYYFLAILILTHLTYGLY